MPRKCRSILEGILCHHMIQGINREYIFKFKEDKKKYLQLLKKYYNNYDIYVVAYCIMNNHVHLLLYSEKISNISNFMRQVNSIYAMYYNKKMKRVGYVYRNRFDSVPIMTKNQMYTCIKYIHMNPVKAGIVENEKQYEFSSYNDYLNQTGFVNQEILEFVFNSSQNYIEIFQKIKYENMNLDKEKCNINKQFTDFLSEKSIDLNVRNKDKQLVKQFINYMSLNDCNVSKVEIAKFFEVSRATLYRWLNE